MQDCFMLARVRTDWSERERKIERERERECLFLKGMTIALAPFSYLVKKCASRIVNYARKKFYTTGTRTAGPR